MSPSVQVLAVGAAAPAWRVQASDVGAAWGRGGRGQAAVCAPDEDTLTLAAEAAGRALAASGLQTDIVDGLWWGTTRPPFAEGPSHAVLAGAIGLSHRSAGALCSGSPHAGMEALLGAADAIGAGSARVALVVVSDALVPGPGTPFEARAGAGAAAAVLVSFGGNASLGTRATRTHAFLDRYRGDGEDDTRDIYDPRLFREEVFVPMLRELGEQVAAAEEVGGWSLPDPDGRLASVVAKQIGADAPISSGVYTELGDTGAAAALLGAIGALDATGTVAVVGYGGGRATGVTLAAKDAVHGAASVADVITGGTTVGYADVLRSRGQLVPSGETVAMGVPPQSAQFVRGADEMLGLLGARCVECGTINTPPSIHPHCIACGSAKFVLEPLARRGTVHTFVVNHTMPAPFVAPLPLAVIDLEDGARVMLQVIGDGKGLEIGSTVELVLRRYAHERGVPVYGYKARLSEANDRSERSNGQESE